MMMFFKAFELPEMAGLPIGGNVGDFFYRLEVHYNNPNKNAGQSVGLQCKISHFDEYLKSA